LALARRHLDSRKLAADWRAGTTPFEHVQLSQAWAESRESARLLRIVKVEELYA
jgi:hypothetical protein